MRLGRASLYFTAALFCAALALFPKANFPVLSAQQFNQDVAVASGATYVSLRAINAALSMAQEVEVGASLGVSGNLQPLKWLEPVDDTVERVSELVFYVAVLSGVIALALAPVSTVGFVLLAMFFVWRGGCAALGRGGPTVLNHGAGGCGRVGLILALGLPVAFALGALAGELLTRQISVEANMQLSLVADQARSLIGEPGTLEEDRSLRETMSAYLGAAELFWSEADALLAASLKLVGIFLLRMVILPLVLLFAILQILGRARRSVAHVRDD